MSPQAWWFGRTMSDAPWRLRVHLPAMDDETRNAVSGWLRERFFPAVLETPAGVRVELEILAGESDRPAGDT